VEQPDKATHLPGVWRSIRIAPRSLITLPIAVVSVSFAPLPAIPRRLHRAWERTFRFDLLWDEAVVRLPDAGCQLSARADKGKPLLHTANLQARHTDPNIVAMPLSLKGM